MRKPIVYATLLFSYAACLEQAEALTFRRVSIIPGEGATAVERSYAQILADRLAEWCGVKVTIAADADAEPRDTDHATILLGLPVTHAVLMQRCQEEKIKLPDDMDPGAEGFVVQGVARNRGLQILAAATDQRGVLYAAGEIVRQAADTDDGIVLPRRLHVRTAPAFEVRGTEVSQGHTMLQLTGVRKWRPGEWHHALFDHALAGANTFAGGHVTTTGESAWEFMTSHGFKTLTSLSGNGGSGPLEWQATEAIGRKGYLCLSVPEARASILQAVESRFKGGRSYDYVRMYSGDGGGCECDKCAPYGKTYIEMCADMAAIIHKYHPETQIFATNQKLDNAGDRAIFKYLQEEPRTWLRALCFGPGSNAMSWQPGRRQDHRMDLFRYPSFGPFDRYLREILHQLPPHNDIVFFTGVTHWVYSEYGLVGWAPKPDRDGNLPPRWGGWVYRKAPDPALDTVYNRRTFHARPRHYHHAFQETLRYGIGDVTYSEGHHDHFNQWMWQRLLWAPHTSVEEVVADYARLFFGREAAPLMAKAIFQLEENLSTPLADNPGIDRLYLLVREAGWKMPPRRMQRDYLWRQYMQKAALDKYVQLRLRRQLTREERVIARLRLAIEAGDVAAALADAKARLVKDIESTDMKTLCVEAGRLGDESAQVFGVRNDGYFNLEHDFVGLGWLQREIDRAVDLPSGEQPNALRRIVDYEDPGPGGFYEDAGDADRSPHMTKGWRFTSGGLSGFNRPSQRRLAFTPEDEVGVTFEYDNLDSAAQYRVRLTLVRPRYLPRFGVRQKQKTQSIYADDHCLDKDLELPEYECGFFEYDIPKEVTADGKLRLWCKKTAGVGEGPRPQVTVWRNTGGWGTLVSEVWLMKK